MRNDGNVPNFSYPVVSRPLLPEPADEDRSYTPYARQSLYTPPKHLPAHLVYNLLPLSSKLPESDHKNILSPKSGIRRSLRAESSEHPGKNPDNKIRRCHDHVMPCFGCFNSAFFTTPRHHSGTRCQAAFKYFIPSQQLPAVVIEEFLHPMNEIALQLLHIRQSLLPSSSSGTKDTSSSFPYWPHLRRHEYIPKGRYLHHLRQYILQKSKGVFIADTELPNLHRVCRSKTTEETQPALLPSAPASLSRE